MTFRLYIRALIRVPLLVAALVVLPATSEAFAFTAPTLSAPASGAKLGSGDAVEFTFSGSLQGDSSALERSFYKLQVAKSSVVSESDSQASWPTVVAEVMTTAGDDSAAAHSISSGAPGDGSYSWRICAWGVANANASQSLAQLACSSIRTFTTSTSSSSWDAPDQVTVTRNRTVKDPDRRITRVRDGATSAPTVKRVILKRAAPKVEEAADDTSFGTDGSSVNLGSEGLDLSARKEEGDSLSGAVTTRLGMTLPGVPLPFWSLLIFILAVPLTRMWRQSMVRMFTFTDVDGNPVADDDSSLG